MPLGAITVAFHLNPMLVMAHFLLAMIVITFATWMTVQVWRRADDERTAPVSKGARAARGVGRGHGVHHAGDDGRLRDGRGAAPRQRDDPDPPAR